VYQGFRVTCVEYSRNGASHIPQTERKECEAFDPNRPTQDCAGCAIGMAVRALLGVDGTNTQEAIAQAGQASGPTTTAFIST